MPSEPIGASLVIESDRRDARAPTPSTHREQRQYDRSLCTPDHPQRSLAFSSMHRAGPELKQSSEPRDASPFEASLELMRLLEEVLHQRAADQVRTCSRWS